MDDFYKTCRWCRWNKNGECQHSGTFAVDSLKAECRLDDGIIYEAVKEAFSDKTFAKLKRNLESSLSKKKRTCSIKSSCRNLKICNATGRWLLIML